MFKKMVKSALIGSVLIAFISAEMVFIKLDLKDFDRTAAQVLNGENSRRSDKQPLLTFSYNLMSLADREIKKMIKADSVLKPNLDVILMRKNIVAKVDKYSSFIDPDTKSIFQLFCF